MRLERLLAIVIILLSRKRVTARELSDRFSVTVRTIYRDIEAIGAAGIPVVTHQGQGGGFEIMESYRLNRQVLTFRDMVALISTFRGVSSILNNDDLKLALEKITGLLPAERKDELDECCEQVAIDIVPWGPQDRLKSLFGSINKAIAEQRCLFLSYRDQKSTKTQRVVEPMTLVFKGSSWYLFGYCRLRKEYRNFRLSRVIELEFSEERFERKKGSYKDHLDPEATAPMIHIVLECDEVLRETMEGFFGPECILSTEDAKFRVSVDLPDNGWVEGYILSYGFHAEVREPAYLRQRIKALIKKMNALYQT